MENQIHGTDVVAVGTKLDKLVKKPDVKQLFMFSAITWNRHAIHYNRQRAREEGLPDVVVQRGLIGNFFAQLLDQWMQDRGDILRLEWKVVRSAIPGDTLTCSGVVRRKFSRRGDTLFECDLEMVNQEADAIAKGVGTVRFDN
jgi:hydroxyacyl-ACP dehydratase HTD2-like protein with hotdog domain